MKSLRGEVLGPGSDCFDSTEGRWLLHVCMTGGGEKTGGYQVNSLKQISIIESGSIMFEQTNRNKRKNRLVS